MGLFSRRSSAHWRNRMGFSSSFGDDLTRFGRYSLTKSGDDDILFKVNQMFPSLAGKAEADPQGFTSEVKDIAITAGGWAMLGGVRFISELGIPEDFVNDPSYGALMQEVSEFLRSQNVSAAYLTGYEREWWGKAHPGEVW